MQSEVHAGPLASAVATIRIRAIATADTDGSHSSLVDHTDKVNDRCGYKYRIEKTDITALVNGATALFTDMDLDFDPNHDFEFHRNTLLNRDSLTPPETIPETQHVLYRDANGHIQDVSAGDKWTLTDLTAATASPAAAGPPAAYLTSASAVKHVVYRSGDGAIHELFTSGGKWTHNPISGRAAAPAAGGDPFGFTTFDPASGQMNNQHVVYRGADRNVHQLYTTTTWNHRILNTLVGAPKAAGNPIGYTTFDGGGQMVVQHVVYRGEDSRLYELYTVGDQWRLSKLTELTGAPAPYGDPFAYTTDYGDVQHIVYRAKDRHVHELFARTEWRHKDLTAATGGPDIHADPVAFVTNDTDTGVIDHQHVIFPDPQGRIRELFTANSGGWSVRDVTDATGMSFPVGPATYTNAAKTVAHVVFRDSAGRLTELFFDAIRSTWNKTDLTAASGAVPATQTLFGYFITDDQLCGLTRNRLARSHRGSLVVFFRYGGQGWSNAIDEFVVMPSVWNPNDLTFLAHEAGHYFHLRHTFYGDSLQNAAVAIKKYVERLAKEANGGQLPSSIPATLIDRGLEVIDADRPYVTDTPAELALVQKDDCNTYPHPASISVTFETKQSKTYNFDVAAQQNVMNYAPKKGFPARFSGGQTLFMRIALKLRNRRHLIASP